MINGNEMELLHLSLEELENRALEHRLSAQANAIMRAEADRAIELEKQEKILLEARSYLPLSLHASVKFSHFAAIRGYEGMIVDHAAVILIETETWQVYMQLVARTFPAGEAVWVLRKEYAFTPLAPEVKDGEESGWYVYWRILEANATDDLIQAIDVAMDHGSVAEMQLESDLRNTASKSAAPEPVYQDEPAPLGKSLVAELYQFVKDIAAEVYEEQRILEAGPVL